MLQNPLEHACHLCGRSSSREVLSLDVPSREGGFRLFRCVSCGLEFVWPMPSDAEALQLYDESYYRNGYLAHEADRRKQFLMLLARLRERGASGPLLDVGAGIGLLVSVAKQEGWQAEGIEPSAAACRLARELYGIHLTCGQITEVAPAPDFGVVALWQVLAHVSDPLEVLRSAAKMLRPDGLLVMSSIHWNDPHYRLAKLLTQWKKVNAIHMGTILWRFRADHLNSLARRAGLRVESVEFGPRPFRTSWGWKRQLFEQIFEVYRTATGTGEEILLWCRPFNSAPRRIETDNHAESGTWYASPQAPSSSQRVTTP